MIIKKLNKFTIFIGLAGFIVSLYALIVHVKNLMAPGGSSLCDINSTISCSVVIGSKYGEFAAIPLGAYGMAYFAIILAAALTPKFAPLTHQQLSKLELVIALIGVCVVAVLMTISYSILKMVCPTCSIVHVLVLLYAILKTVQFVKLKKEQYNAHAPSIHDAYMKFFALSLCLALPPLMAGLISPMLVYYFGNKTNVSLPDTRVSTPAMVSDTELQAKLKAELMTFNKSNYVGNGEDYHRGNENAPVVVQMFSDFGCPHCKTANEALLRAQDMVGLDKVVLVYRFYPLSNECNSFVGAKGWYTYNCSLVIAARCAGQQGNFWEFKEWAFSGQDWTNQMRDKNFSSEGLKIEAKNLKMNVEEFSQCLEGHSEDNKIKDDIILANQLNIQGTPLIIINGDVYKGPQETNIFVQLFERALEGK